MDPRWFQSDISLTYFNSYKMKLSVIFAILQMSLGIFLKGFNSVYFRKTQDFLFEFIPQIFILWNLFLWMDILIVGKWITPRNVEGNWAPTQNYYTDGGNGVAAQTFDPNNEYNRIHYAPSLYSMMIDYVMPASNQVAAVAGMNTINYANGTISPPIDAPLYSIKYSFVVGDSQRTIQAVLEILLIVFIPVLLCVKPCIVKFSHHEPHAAHVQVHTESIQYEKNPEGKGITRNERYEQIQNILEKENVPVEAHSFGDAFIHQLIETIEFVLGTISNTASYLRLWALSLAHAQLSAVLLEQVMAMAFENESLALGGILVRQF
jgi:V-type H+-transporting ATPase subunit a